VSKMEPTTESEHHTDIHIEIDVRRHRDREFYFIANEFMLSCFPAQNGHLTHYTYSAFLSVSSISGLKYMTFLYQFTLC
jgi:hypothetical protein